MYGLMYDLASLHCENLLSLIIKHIYIIKVTCLFNRTYLFRKRIIITLLTVLETQLLVMLTAPEDQLSIY